MFGLGHTPEIIILLVIVLLVFGPGKLPEIGSAVGRGIREFKNATTGNDEHVTPTITQAPPARPIQPPAQEWAPPAVEHREPVEAGRVTHDQ